MGHPAAKKHAKRCWAAASALWQQRAVQEGPEEKASKGTGPLPGAHLAVAHVGVAGQTNGGAVRLDSAPPLGHCLQPIGGGGVGCMDGIPLIRNVITLHQ
jgi:hypothetical protein